MFESNFCIRVKNEISPMLFALPGVVGVGLGPKFVSGRPIGQLAIQVFVERKKNVSFLDSSEIIPKFFQDIPTDVLEGSYPVNTADQITISGCSTNTIKAVTRATDSNNIPINKIQAPGHGLFDGEWVTIRGKAAITTLGYQVSVIDTDNFSIKVVENGNDIPPVDTASYQTDTASFYVISTMDTLCCCPGKKIDTVSAGEEVVITSSAHGLHNGDFVKRKKGSNPKLEPEIYKIKKVDDNNFTLLHADPSKFQTNPDGSQWRKLSMSMTGRITAIEMKNPIVIHSANHGLKKDTKLVVITMNNITQQKLDNLSNEQAPLYNVTDVQINTFSLSKPDEKGVFQKIDASAWGPDLQQDVLGIWIAINEDKKKYGRIWGGVRIETEDADVEIADTPNAIDDRNSNALTTRSGKSQEVHVHTEHVVSVGTVGCIAIDNADPNKRKVLLSCAHVLTSGTGNTDVHHPDYYVSSKTCSSHKVAEMIKTRSVRGAAPAPNQNIFVDAGIAFFEENVQTDPIITDIGKVKGIHAIDPNELINGDYRVWKRGAISGLTEGFLISSEFDFPDKKTNTIWKSQLRISPISGTGRGFINVHGDSGAALVNKNNEVVGLIHSADASGFGYASAITHVQKVLNITIWADDGTPPAAPQSMSVGIPELFANAMEEITDTDTGSTVLAIVQSHYPEVVRMLSENKKFAVAWHRNDGPLLLQQLRSTIEVRNRPVPETINERPFSELLLNIFAAFKEFGSPKLVADVNKYADYFARLFKLSYNEILHSFKNKKMAEELA